ncbi:MAG: response regulator [Spirochaetales bacterium]|nr:response regulator [Spirochaetales bacterium]
MQLSLILIGIFLALAVYHFLIFTGRRKDLSNLGYAVLCFVFAGTVLYTKIISQTAVYNIDLKNFFRVVIPLINGMLVAFITYSIYDLRKIKIYILSFVILSVVLGSIFSPLYIMTRQNIFVQIIDVFVVIYTVVYTFLVLYLIFKEKQYKKRKVKITLIGFILFLLVIIARQIVNVLLVNPAVSDFLMDFGYFMLAVIFAYALTDSFNREHKDLIELKDTLEQKVKLRTEELEQANIQKTTFFVNLAHEIKTPLTLITNYFEKYINEHKNSRDLEIIKNNLNRLRHDVVNFLDIEKLERGQIFYDHNEITDVSTVMEMKIEIFRETAVRKHITIDGKIDKELYTRIDPYALDRIINNLMDNAIRYTPENGAIQVILQDGRDSIELTVEDNGVGISGEQQKHIFEPYYQLSHAKRNIQGIGMGLHIVHNIVSEVDGRIAIDSETGNGTRFSIFLNKAEVADSSEIQKDIILSNPINSFKKAALKNGEFREQCENILLIEDNIDMLVYLQDNLKAGYNVFCAMNGKEALQKIRVIPQPHLIISDIMMDTMDGYEFFNELQKLEKFKNIPFIFLTAKNSRDEKLEGIRKGAIDYIFKPFYMDELNAKIEAVLRQQKATVQSSIEDMKKKILTVLDETSINSGGYSAYIAQCKKYNISTREKDVLDLLIKGLENKEISAQLNVSLNTVKKHVFNIFKKCSVQNRVEIVNLFNERSLQ